MTAALNNLSEAQEAEVDFREAAPALDSTNNVVNANSIDVDAGEASADDIKEYYDDVAKSVGDSSNVAVNGFEGKTAATQDAYIAAYETSLSADVDAASADLPANMASLISTVESRKDAVVEKLKAANDKLDNYNAEIAAFESANSTITVSSDVEYDEDYDASANNSGKKIIADGKAFTGEDGTTTAVDLSDLTEDKTVKRVTELEAAYDAKQAADKAVTNAKTSLESAIADVYVAENDAFEVVDGQAANAVSYTATAGGEAAVVDLTSNISVFETEAAKNDATAEVQSFTITAESTDNDDEALTITYGTDGAGGTASVEVDLSSVDVTDASVVATEVAAQRRQHLQ